MSEQITFIERCLAGATRPEDIEEWVGAWHDSKDDRSLAGFLGMTDEEYAVWVEQPDSLLFILHAHRFNLSLRDALSKRSGVRLAARASRGARDELIAWLKQTGRL